MPMSTLARQSYTSIFGRKSQVGTYHIPEGYQDGR